MKAALDTIGMDEETQIQVWKMLASVLYMSNVEFDKVDHEQGEIASISDHEVCTTHGTRHAFVVSHLGLVVSCRWHVGASSTFCSIVDPRYHVRSTIYWGSWIDDYLVKMNKATPSVATVRM